MSEFPADRGSLLGELKRLLALGLPVAGTQLCFMMLGTVDTAMLGHFDARALAAAGIGNMWHWAVTSLAFGTVLGVEAILSQAYGRGDHEGLALGLQRGILVALLTSVPACVLQAFAEPVLLLFGQQAELASAAGSYCILRLPSVPAFLLVMALRVYLQARGIVWPAFFMALLANGINVALNWALIYDVLELGWGGLEGGAVATSLTSISLPLLLYLYCRWARLFTGFSRPWDEKSWALPGVLQVLTLGFPIGIQTALEGWAFGAASLFAGYLGTHALASYQITLHVAATLFMIPLGLSIGASTRVGNLIGARDLSGARRAIQVAFGAGVAWSIASGAGLLLLGGSIPRLFTEDAIVSRMVESSLIAVVAFQLFDASQAISAGVLRAMGRPHAGAVINAIAFFCVALPAAYYFAVVRGGGVLALWLGMAFGLFLVAAGTSIWVAFLSRKCIEELEVRITDGQLSGKHS